MKYLFWITLNEIYIFEFHIDLNLELHLEKNLELFNDILI